MAPVPPGAGEAKSDPIPSASPAPGGTGLRPSRGKPVPPGAGDASSVVFLRPQKSERLPVRDALASLTGKRPYYAKASLTGKRPRPPYGGRADLNIFSPADIRGKKIRLFVYSPGAQSLSPVTLLPGMRSFFFHLDIPIKECPRFSTKNAYERTSLASRSPPSGG